MFDLQGAMSAGANPNDVLDFLAKQTGYNATGAIKAGAKQSDVLAYMAKLPTAKPAQPPATGIFGGGNPVSGVANALTSSEQGAGNDIAATIGESIPAVKFAQAGAQAANQQLQGVFQKVLVARHALAQQGKDTSALDSILKEDAKTLGVTNLNELIPEAAKKTTGQIVGDFAGTALDVASAGSYGEAAKGAKTGELLTKGATAAAPIADTAAKQGLGTTLKTIGAKTAVRAGVGAATGYGYDVTNNLQGGKTGASAFMPGTGTALGAAIPIGIGSIEATHAITKDLAPRFINSLIKPNAASFAYGKDPGRTVAAMGITGNSLSDFTQNIAKAKDDVGSKLGAIYTAPENAAVRIDGTSAVQRLDSAISDAAKGGKNNQGIVTTLQNIKDSLLFEHTTDKDGNIVKVTGADGQAIPRDLSSLTPQEAFNLKQEIAAQTKFTGRPSDDKTVNSLLKNIYGDLKQKLNAGVAGNNPEVRELNQRYADLTSAELATRNRDAIVQRSNMISAPVKVGTAAGIIAALGTGGAAVPALLAGAGAAALDKALESTAVKSRVAAWLGSESPTVISNVLRKNPGIRTVLYRALPKLASKLGQ